MDGDEHVVRDVVERMQMEVLARKRDRNRKIRVGDREVHAVLDLAEWEHQQ